MFDIFAYLSHHIYMSIFPYLTKNVFKPRFIICIFIVGTEQSVVLNKCSIIFIKWIDKVHIHFPYSHHKHLRGHNILTSFFRRILSFITHILSSKTYTESEYLPSAFEQKVGHEADYIRDRHESNFVASPSCIKRQGV